MGRPEALPARTPGTTSRLPGSGPQRLSPEEEAEGAHLPQVHAEHTADLLQGAGPLGLVPARGLQEAGAVREPQLGVGTRGGAGGAGRRVATRLVPCPRSHRHRAGRVWGDTQPGPGREHTHRGDWRHRVGGGPRN